MQEEFIAGRESAGEKLLSVDLSRDLYGDAAIFRLIHNKEAVLHVTDGTDSAVLDFRF